MGDLQIASSSMTSKKTDKELPSTTINLNTNFLVITDENDFPYILQGVGSRLLVMEFFADWCGPCQKIGASMEDLAKSYDGKILVVKIDVEACEDLVTKYNISAIPTFIMMKDQKKVDELSSSNIETLQKKLEKLVGKPVTNKETESAKKGRQSVLEKKKK